MVSWLPKYPNFQGFQGPHFQVNHVKLWEGKPPFPGLGLVKSITEIQFAYEFVGEHTNRRKTMGCLRVRQSLAKKLLGNSSGIFGHSLRLKRILQHRDLRTHVRSVCSNMLSHYEVLIIG